MQVGRDAVHAPDAGGDAGDAPGTVAVFLNEHAHVVYASIGECRVDALLGDAWGVSHDAGGDR